MTQALAWTRLSLSEEGGFAALRRGVSLLAADLPAPLVVRVGTWLAELSAAVAEADKAGPAAYPDAQHIGLSFEAAGREWQWRFDASDLPAALARLVDELRPLFKPLPLP